MKIQILKIELEFYNRICADRNCRSIYLCRVHSIFRFLVKVTLVKVTKKRKKQLSFLGKMQIFYPENK